MRYKLLLFTMLMLPWLGNSQCDYVLEVEDVNGLGWFDPSGNAAVEIVIDGVVVVSDNTWVNAGTGAPGRTNINTFTVNTGDNLELDYVAPLLPGDVEFRLFDSEGILLYQSNLAPTTADDIYTETVQCPTCAAPTNLMTSNIMPRDVQLSWTSNGTETEWEVEFNDAPYVAGTGGPVVVFAVGDPNVTVTGSNPRVVTVTLDGLTPETEYDYYVRAVCDRATGDISASRGPGNFTTTASCPAILSFTPGTTNANDVTFTINNAQGNMENNYTVYYGPSPLMGITDPNAIVETGTSAPVIFVDGLFSNTSYDFFVVLNCGPDDDSQPSVRYTVATQQVCPNISNLVISNVTRNSVDLAWTNNASSTEWEISYAEGFIAGNPNVTTITVNTNPVTIDMLDSSTDYQICVRAKCSPLDFSDNECGFFETIPDYCAGDLFLDSGGTLGNYGNDENIVYTICPDSPGDIVYVDFTEFNLEQRANNNCFDFLTIYDGDSVTDPIIPAPRGTGNNSQWCFNRASGIGTGDLTNFPLFSTSPSGCLTFVFTSNDRITASGFEASVTCAPPPTCPAPTELEITQVFGEGAVFGWTANAGASEWEIEVQPDGVPLGTMPAVLSATATTNPFALDTLTPGTSYDVYVRAICDPTDLSRWAGPVTFSTGCATESAPYFFGFDNGLDACWNFVNDRGISEGPVFTTTNYWDFFDFANQSSPPSGEALFVSLDDDGRQQDDWVVSPMIDLGALNHGLGIQFDVAVTEFFDTTPGTWGVDDKVELLITRDLGLNWTVLRTYDSNSNISNTGQNEDINLAGTSGKVRFAFKSSIGTISDSDAIDFWIDNFQIDATASSGSVEVPGVQAYPNPTTSMLNVSAETMINKVEVFNLLGQQVDVMDNDSLNATIDMSAYSNGLYLVRITSGEASSTIKIAKE